MPRAVEQIAHRSAVPILSLDEKLEPTFGNYLLGRLPELLADFKAGKD
jgi:hypothetical protein